jgi:hypothetical protein
MMTYQKYLLTHLQFTEPKSIQEKDAFEHFQNLAPDERTELLAKMFAEYMALSRILGSYEKGCVK